MATNFPVSLDTLTNPTSSDSLSSPSHSSQHANANDAIEALQAKVGADSSAVTSSLDYKVAQLEAISHGKILQVVSTTKTDTFSASVAAGAETAITGLSATITPTSATSKILVLGYLNATHGAGAGGVYGYIYRDAALLTGASGDAAGNRKRGYGAGLRSSGNLGIPFFYLDSPATTSAVIYDLRMSHDSAGTYTMYVNRGYADTDNAQYMRQVCNITVMEVSA